MSEAEKTGEGREPGPPPGAERRAAPRHASTLVLTCYPAGAGLGERRRARVRNVSRTGIGLAIDRRWDPGTTLVLEMPAEGEGPVRTLQVQVVHNTPQLGGLILVGCTFQAPLSDADLQALAR